jgi:hypothetical protein
LQDAVLQVLRAKCVPAGSGLRVAVVTGPAWPDDELRLELCDELLCEDELWLEPLDFAPAGAIASAAATTAMDSDKASLEFGIVSPRVRITEE